MNTKLGPLAVRAITTCLPNGIVRFCHKPDGCANPIEYTIKSKNLVPFACNAVRVIWNGFGNYAEVLTLDNVSITVAFVETKTLDGRYCI